LQFAIRLSDDLRLREVLALASQDLCQMIVKKSRHEMAKKEAGRN
jgi:hypothetical protein